MTRFDDIYEIASDNYGVVTSAEALEVGVTYTELNRHVKNGRLERLGHGVYKLTRYIPTANDHFAAAVALVGPGAFIYGESVLSMHKLALVNPRKVYVATSRRIRKSLPEWISVITVSEDEIPTNYEGIPSQSVADALLFCTRSVMRDRLIRAAQDAEREGLIDKATESALRESLAA